MIRDRARVCADVHIEGVPLYVCDACGRAAPAKVERTMRHGGPDGDELRCEGWCDPPGWLVFRVPAGADDWREVTACPDCRPAVVAAVVQFVDVLTEKQP